MLVVLSANRQIELTPIQILKGSFKNKKIGGD